MLEMNSTGSDTVLGNAKIVLADRVIERGWIAFAGSRIAEFGEGDAPGGASEDAAGDLIMPGLIELHTDHLEVHYVPRPRVFWDPVAAVISYDGQLATSGITTVLDSLRVWRDDGAEEVDGRAGVLAAAIGSARHPTFCAPITSCICAAKFRCQAWSRKPKSWSADPTCV
jgi:alpha-D-ribose 1-methylphosphonate 5-triphosphate diphosphatase